MKRNHIVLLTAIVLIAVFLISACAESMQASISPAPVNVAGDYPTITVKKPVSEAIEAIQSAAADHKADSILFGLPLSEEKEAEETESIDDISAAAPGEPEETADESAGATTQTDPDPAATSARKSHRTAAAPDRKSTATTAKNSQHRRSHLEDVKELLNSIPLHPTVTGYDPVDKKVEEIFAKIFRPNMTTYDKVRACFDYLVDNVEYGHDYVNDYGEPDDPIPAYVYWDDRYILSGSIEPLFGGRGVCTNYSMAFVVMCSRIGLVLQPQGGKIHAKGEGPDSYIGHIWTYLEWDGQRYVFDPQVQDNNPKSPYYFFGRTYEQMNGLYRPDEDYGCLRHGFEIISYDPQPTTTTVCDETESTATTAFEEAEPTATAVDSRESEPVTTAPPIEADAEDNSNREEGTGENTNSDDCPVESGASSEA